MAQGRKTEWEKSM